MQTEQLIPIAIEESPAPSAVEMALHIYKSRRDRILATREDELGYMSLLDSFQRAAKELASQARSVFKYNDDTDQRIMAKELLDSLKQDAQLVAYIGYAFSLRHEEAKDIDVADSMADAVLDMLTLHGRISATIENIKSGKDANIIAREKQIKAIAYAGPKSGEIMNAVVERGQSEYHTVYPYPLICPPPGERVPQLPKNFERYLDLPACEMDLGEKGALSIPIGYTDAEGNDLTNLWRIDWSTGEVIAGLTDEDTDYGRVRWKAFCRERPGLDMPQECREYWSRLTKQEMGL